MQHTPGRGGRGGEGGNKHSLDIVTKSAVGKTSCLQMIADLSVEENGDDDEAATIELDARLSTVGGHDGLDDEGVTLLEEKTLTTRKLFLAVIVSCLILDLGNGRNISE